MIKFLGGLCIACGLITLLSGRWEGISFFIMALFIMGISGGIQIDKKEGRIRRYISVVGFRFGEWQSFTNYKCLLISEGSTGYSESGGEITAYQLFLVPIDKNKHKSILLGEFAHLKNIQDRAEELAEELKIELKSKF